MRLPFTRPRWALLDSQGGHQALDVAVFNDTAQLKSPRSGKVLETLPLTQLGLLPCGVAGRKEHCLALQLPATQRELVLRAPSRSSADALLKQLSDAAEVARRKASAKEAAERDTSAGSEALIPAARLACKPQHPSELQQQAEGTPPAEGTLEPSLRRQVPHHHQQQVTATLGAAALSFGSPVSQDGDLEAEAEAEAEGRPSRRHSGAAEDVGPVLPQAGGDREEGEALDAHMPAHTQAAKNGGAAPALAGCRQSAALQSPAAEPGKTNVQLLAEAVARLGLGLVPARHGACRPASATAALPAGQHAAGVGVPAPAAQRPASAAPALAAPCCSPLASPPLHPPRRQLLVEQEFPSAQGAAPKEAGGAAGAPAAASSWALEALVRENTLLLEQQAVLEAEVCRVHTQLTAAAGDNVRLAHEAASAVVQLRSAAAAASEAARREQALRAELGQAVARCEAAARELGTLGPRLERSSAQCEELCRTAQELSREKTLLTAALTAAQLQLRNATPAGFAAQAAELAAAREDAAAARKAAAAAEKQLSEAQARQTEAAAAAAAATARADEAAGRERAALAELAAAKEGAAGGGAAKERAAALEAANAGLQQDKVALAAQVGQLQAMGEELSASCAALERSLQAAGRDREGLQAALAAAQQAAWAAHERGQGLAAAASRGSADQGGGSAAAAVALSAQVESLRQEVQEARRTAAAREAELHSELRLLKVTSEVEARALKDRAEAAAASASAERAAQAEALRQAREALIAREAEAAAAEREASAAAAELAQVREEARRVQEHAAVAERDLQLELRGQQGEAARLAEEAKQARVEAAAGSAAAEEAGRRALQAEASLATALAAQQAASAERKVLQAGLERARVEHGRAAREREALRLKVQALQQQCKLMEAATAGQGVVGLGSSGGSWVGRRAAAGPRVYN